jgi:hypothetical protein
VQFLLLVLFLVHAVCCLAGFAEYHGEPALGVLSVLLLIWPKFPPPAM